MNEHKELDTILIDSFGEVFVELVQEKKITTEQYLLLLSRTQQRIKENLAKELKSRTEEVEKLKQKLGLEVAIAKSSLQNHGQKN